VTITIEASSDGLWFIQVRLPAGEPREYFVNDVDAAMAMVAQEMTTWREIEQYMDRFGT
jgi:hypothetical protein